ncbi:unknown [Haloarcula marismortui ATCC 43049]|jgi:ferredoxin|uniref:Ferredoxin n=1 Tax=Haloarcula marismortui (strain ATCC 43049 / DSM 3752 / JCM 8966 / VKM B-1809) TaxID=272569 RepID=Q5UYB8_HALMA|nr:ferredoxin [Haloarcula marismortui]AAV47735.1 unknown [Haloarcula marismortui ATCC 43049]QCP92419.1 ferredoxin [Haloarcula marismortui ATCC 43049]
MYRITIDRDACDGVFACLVRDDRFVEDSEGLAAIETDDQTAIEATFDDDRRDDAEQAAAACPLDAIHVESVEEDAGAADTPAATDHEEVQP